jgi:hypothetical protein
MSTIPRIEWARFLEIFGRTHHGWPTRVETKDHVTEERVLTGEVLLQSMELDLEDEHHPRINVSVRLDNKTVKHILFEPARVVLRSCAASFEESLEIETLNTVTTVYVRAPREHRDQ